MAITTAMCTSFKGELLSATHDFDNGANSFKLSLYAIGSGGKSSTTATLARLLQLSPLQGKLRLVAVMLPEELH